MIQRMAGNQQVDFSPDIFAIFMCIEDIFAEEEGAVGPSYCQGRSRQNGVILNTVQVHLQGVKVSSLT